MNYSNFIERSCLEHEKGIIMVCFNENCQANRLLCAKCNQYHTAHANQLDDINILEEKISILIKDSNKILHCFNIPIDNIINNNDQLKNMVTQNKNIFVTRLKEEIYHFDKKCSKHNNDILMICQKKMCNSNKLVCHLCIADHSNHLKCLLDRENFNKMQEKTIKNAETISTLLISQIDNFSCAIDKFKEKLQEKYSITLKNFMDMNNRQISSQFNLLLNFIDRNQKDIYQQILLFLQLISKKMEYFSKLIKASSNSIELIEKFLEESRKQGEVLRVLVKYQESIQKQDEVLLNSPYDVVILWGKGEALRMLGQYLKSIQWFEKALAIDLKHVYSQWGIGDSLQLLGQYKESIEWFDKALAMDPKHVFSLFGKGKALSWIGQYKESIEWFDKALSIDPKHVDSLFGKGKALSWIGKYKESIEWFDKALAIEPKHVFSLFGKGEALQFLGQYKESIKWYDKVLAIDPQHVNSLFQKGQSLNKIGKYQEAFNVLSQAQDFKPNDQWIQDALNFSKQKLNK